MTDMSEVPEKSYKHLTDEDLGILLGTYSIIKSGDNPKELVNIDIPRGHELIVEIQKRLKKSGPNLSWDQAVERRQTPNLGFTGLPCTLDLDDLFDNREKLLKDFGNLMGSLGIKGSYPQDWESPREMERRFEQAGNDWRDNLWGSDPRDYAVYFTELTNPVLAEINKNKPAESKVHWFIGLKSNRQELLG